jgi:hypothetical protein
MSSSDLSKRCDVCNSELIDYGFPIKVDCPYCTIKDRLAVSINRESLAREALQACDNFLDYSHAGSGNQNLAYLYVKMLIKEWLNG